MARIRLDNGGTSSSSTTTAGDAITIQGRAMAATAPSDGSVIVYDSATSSWIPSSTLLFGSVPAGVADDYGIYPPSNTSSLSLWSLKATASGVASVDAVADVNAAAINAGHKIFRIGWVNNADTYTESFYFTPTEIRSATVGSIRLFGDIADGASAVATYVGSDSNFFTAGAKLLSVYNGLYGYERAYVDYMGDLCFNMRNNGQYLAIKSTTSEETIAASAFTDSTLTIPAGSTVLAVSSRVISTIPTATGIDIGIPGSLTRFGWALGTTLGGTNSGQAAGVGYYHYSSPIRITPSSTPASASGKIRLTLHYMTINPPTS